jgi:ABC-type amino acid transport substrate-binding protein
LYQFKIPLKSRIAFVVLISFASFQAQLATSAEPITIGYIDLPEVLDSSGKSAPYNELMARLLKRTGQPYNTLFIPSARSNYLLNQNRINCVFPVIPHFYKRSMPTLFSTATNKVTSHVFSISSPAVNSIKDLTGKMIAYRKGLIFGTLFDKFELVRFVPVDSESVALRLMRENRVDAYLAYYPDIKISMDENDRKQLFYSKEFPLTSSEDKLECTDNTLNKRFIEKFDAELNKMKASGELKQVLGSYYNF